MCLAWRPFSQHDWYGYAGAERFDDGAEPLIASIKVDGVRCDALLDAKSIEIIMDGCDEFMSLNPASPAFNTRFRLACARPQMLLAFAVASLKPEMTQDSLELLGFSIRGSL